MSSDCDFPKKKKKKLQTNGLCTCLFGFNVKLCTCCEMSELLIHERNFWIYYENIHKYQERQKQDDCAVPSTDDIFFVTCSDANIPLFACMTEAYFTGIYVGYTSQWGNLNLSLFLILLQITNLYYISFMYEFTTQMI